MTEFDKIKLAAFDNELTKQAMHPGLKAGGVIGALMAALGHGDTSLLGALMAGGSLAGAGVEAAAGDAARDFKDAKNFATSQYKSIKKAIKPDAEKSGKEIAGELKDIKKEAFVKQFREKTAKFFGTPAGDSWVGRNLGRAGTILGLTGVGAAALGTLPVAGPIMAAGGAIAGGAGYLQDYLTKHKVFMDAAGKKGYQAVDKEIENKLTPKHMANEFMSYMGWGNDNSAAMKQPHANYTTAQEMLKQVNSNPSMFGAHSDTVREIANNINAKGKVSDNLLKRYGGLDQVMQYHANDPFHPDVLNHITNNANMQSDYNLARNFLAQQGYKPKIDQATGQIQSFGLDDPAGHFSQINPGRLRLEHLGQMAVKNPGYAMAGLGIGALGMYGAGKALFGGNGGDGSKKKGNTTIIQ